MALSLETKTRIGAILLLAVLVINGLVSYRATRTLIKDQDAVLHTHRVLAELEAILSTLKDAETGERGFIITGAPEYLEPYRAALLEIDGRIRELKRLIAIEPEQQARIPLLEQKVAARLEGLKTGVHLRAINDEQGMKQLLQGGSGKRMMDDLRQYIAGMEGPEEQTLVQRTEEARASARDTTLTFIVANAVCGLILL